MTRALPPIFRGRHPEILILDVDGVLTPNLIYLDGEGQEWKPFFVPDGTGLRLIQVVGVKTALLSGRASRATHKRAEELAIDWYRSGIHDKGAATRELLEESGIGPDKAVYVGDDLVDLPAMDAVGIPVAVANARPEVIERAAAVTECEGGRGAVREVCEWILHARGEWDTAMRRYLP